MVLFAGVTAFTIPGKAGADPAAFINNLGYQLQAVNRNTSTEQRLAGFHELFREDLGLPHFRISVPTPGGVTSAPAAAH